MGLYKEKFHKDSKTQSEAAKSTSARDSEVNNGADNSDSQNDANANPHLFDNLKVNDKE